MEYNSALCLVSGGIDSPVAALLAKQKIKNITLFHAVLYPFYCEKSFSRTIEIIKKLGEKGIRTLILFPWKNVFLTILKGDKKYQCIYCRRGMFLAADMICRKKKIDAIITGESLGQKASQTSWNMFATSQGIKTPILKPLIGMDKNEIISLSRKMGFCPDLHVSCCTAVPKKPVTHANPKKACMLDEEIKKVIKKEKPLEVNISDIDVDVLKLFR